MHLRAPTRITYAACTFLLLLACVLALMNGSTAIHFNDLFFPDHHRTDQAFVSTVIFQIRLPRILLAAAVGALLASSGAITQGLFRNPLADPSLIGVTAGASLGVGLLIAFGEALPANTLGLPSLSLAAFVGGALTVFLVYRLSNSEQGLSVSSMLLSGIAISALAGSTNTLLKYMADNQKLRQMSLWQMGGLDGANLTEGALALAVLLILLLSFPFMHKALNALLLGEGQAMHLGFNVKALKRNLILLVAAAVGISVATAGPIGFVGLVVPHLIRMIVGPDHRHLLPLSAFGGAALLLLADTFARSIWPPIELPAGIVTAWIGAPIFVYLLRKQFQGAGQL